ncbi:MAG: CHAD domain-containing protein [Vicinamibacterales bacterium]
MQRLPLPVRLMRQRLLALLDAMPAAASGDVTSVHRARVASRRLREVLPVLAEAAGSDALDRAGRQVRRITRALGPIRELDVALGHLDEAGARAGVSARALGKVRRHLAEERAIHRRAMLDVITPTALEKLRARLHESPSRSPAREPDAEIRSARRRAARRAAALRVAVRRAGSLYSSERLHETRIAAKKLRYALEVERELMHSRATGRINRLKRVQDQLGNIHDFEILIGRVREVQAALASSDRTTATDLDALVRVLEEECREGHAAFLKERAAITELCRLVIEAARDNRPTFTA